MSEVRRRNWPLLIVVLVGLVIVGHRLLTRPAGDAGDRHFYVSFLVASAFACAMSWIAAFSGPRRDRRPWRWIAVAFTFFVLPQPYAIVYAAQHGGLSDQVILVVLLSRLLWAPLILAGLLSFPMRRLTGRQWTRFAADLATVVGGGFIVTWYFQLGPALTQGSVGALALTVVVLPTTDLVLIFGVCALLMRSGLRSVRGPLPIFLLGIVAYLVGDIVYAHKILLGALSWSTPLATLLCTATLVMAAAATLTPPRLPPGPHEPDRRNPSGVYLPYVALLAGYVMLLVATIRQDVLYPWGGLIVGVVVMTGAVAVRQIMTSRENHGLIVRDHLTGLANRVSVSSALEAAVRRHQSGAGPSAVLMIDLDGFKKVNDTYGHEAGDALLIRFAQVLRGKVRGNDLAARLGGDEFLVLLERLDQPDNRAHAMAVAQRILDAAAQPFSIAGVEVPVRASIGVAMTDQADDEGGAELQHRADMAMYAAKREGRHGVYLWSPTLQDAADDLDALEVDIATAAPAGQLRVLYQPIIDLTTGGIVAAEALVRWEHPTRGLLYPDVFIPVAERTGAIEQIGLWVLEQAATQVSQWQRQAGRPLYVSVNLSPRQLQQPDLVERVTQSLTAAAVQPCELVLELTESALVTETAGVAVLETLRGMGIRIAVDDFGTGYSSLRYLTTLPVDILKLDRSFVNELNGGPKGSAVAEAVIRLAQALALDTVAEGIETESQATELVLLGYRTGQGYHYARPMTAEAMTRILQTAPLGDQAKSEGPHLQPG